jgi:hypothetical protein
MELSQPVIYTGDSTRAERGVCVLTKYYSTVFKKSSGEHIAWNVIGHSQSDFVKEVSLWSKVNEIIADPGKVQGAIAAFKSELTRLQDEIHSLRSRLKVMLRAWDNPLATE